MAGRVMSFCLLLAGLTPCLAAPTISNIRLAADKVPCYGRAEVHLDLSGSWTNPFDPRQVTLDAQFTGPGGLKASMPGFLYQECKRELTPEGREKTTATGPQYWQVRFCPTKPGSWQVKLTATDSTGTATSDPLKFTVIPAASHGFIRRSPDNHYFQYEDGSPLSLIGMDIAWPGKGGTFDYDRQLAKCQQAGMNFARLWLAWGNPVIIETKQSGAGHYDLVNAWRMDYILDAARANGVRVLFSLDTPEQYDKDHNWLGSISHPWADISPHNAANGGPLKEPEEFYTTEAGHQLIRQRLRYIVARWGYDTNIMCWELWNELNCFTGWEKLVPQIVDWHNEMIAEVRRLDPNQHLITTSFGNAYGNDAIWQVKGLDFVQSHLYGFRRIGATYPEVTATMHDRYQKPHVVGEFGPRMEELSQLSKLDPTGINLRDGIWSTMLGGGASSALTWCWDGYVEKMGLYSVYTPLVKFCEGINWPKEGFKSAQVAFTWLTAPPPSPPRDLILPCGESGLAPLLGTATINIAHPPDALGRIYLYGHAQADQEKPITLEMTMPRPGKIILNIGRVEVLGILQIKVDGVPVFDEKFPAGPPGEGPWKRSLWEAEWKIWASWYDKDIAFDLPAGKHSFEMYNAGKDSITIDRVTLTNCITDDSPDLRAVGLVGRQLAVLWVQNRASDWYSLVQQTEIKHVRGAQAMVAGIPPGPCTVEWWNTTSGEITRHESCVAGKTGLLLRLPVVADDVACKIRYAPRR